VQIACAHKSQPANEAPGLSDCFNLLNLENMPLFKRDLIWHKEGKGGPTVVLLESAILPPSPTQGGPRH
jgi:hypothetical protein